jgi:hypothetical protein
VAGIGPQIGFLFPLGSEHQGYLNLKAYKDFAAEKPCGRLHGVGYFGDHARRPGGACQSATDPQIGQRSSRDDNHGDVRFGCAP